jgi:ketosteroid isomerase-like protein
MSEENLERVRQVFELFRTRYSSFEAGIGKDDVAAAGEIFHPDFVLDATRAPMTDLRGTYQGLAEVIDFWRRWLEAWETIDFEDELTDAGDRVLATITRQTMKGKGSGVEVDFPHYWQVFTIRDGLVIRQALYLEEAEALEAAGLSE